MEQVLLHQSQVNFHGIWKAGLRVTDDLIRSVGTTALSKPSRPCLLRLTTSGLTLTLLSTTEGQNRSHQVPFDSLRDVFVNQHQPQCLNIIFLDSEHKFSVMACSSQHESDLVLISSAFKNRRNLLLTNARNQQQQRPPQAPQNWTLREKPAPGPEWQARRVSGERYLKSSSSPNGSYAPGGSRESSGGQNSRPVSTSEDLTDEDVFTESRILIVHEHESLVREPAAISTSRRKGAFDVGVQTVPYVDDYDTESITSALTLQSISSEVSPFQSSDFKTEDISSEMFHHRTTDHHGSHDYITNGHSRSDEDEEFGNSHREDDPNIVNVTNESHTKNQTDDEKINDLRSISTQTELSYKMIRRYAKNQRIRTLSNSYRDRAEAIRKKSSGSKPPPSPNPARVQSTSDHPSRVQPSNDHPSRVQPSSDHPSRVQPSNDQPLAVTSRPPSLGASQRSSVTNHSSTPPSQTIRRTLSVGSSTVIRPIEQVYQPRTAQRSHSGRARQRPVIVYSPASFNRLV